VDPDPTQQPSPVPSQVPSQVPASPPELEPFHVDLPRLVSIGTAAWLVALVLTVAIPALHRDERDWWPWAALSGVLLGVVGLAYIRIGRGNIADMH
jgi:hypothetical protein